MQAEDLERIARGVLRDLGVPNATLTVTAHEAQSDTWRIVVEAENEKTTITVRCGRGSTAQWVREQIFTQFQARQR